MNELPSVVDDGAFNPRIGPSLPGSTSSEHYWSATPFANGPSTECGV